MVPFSCDVDRYDFDKDGLISAEDVRLLLSYIPFRRLHNLERKSEIRLGSEETREGLYDECDGRSLDPKQRTQNQSEINQFLEAAFS